MMSKLSKLSKLVLAACMLFSFSSVAAEKAKQTPKQVLFKNVNVFNGKDNKLYSGLRVLVEGNKIKSISSKAIRTNAKATIIDGGGRTLMPGLIDSHVHFTIYTPASRAARADVDPFLAGAIAGKRAEAYLMRGFTTVRDTGGQSMFIYRAVEAGQIVGPRTYGSGPVLTQTSGHVDMRDRNAEHPNMNGKGPTHWNERYNAFIVDGEDEMIRGAREVLMKYGTFLKLPVSGGVSSEFDPVHMTQFLPEEIRAAVKVADQWGTYVTVHAFTDKAVKNALDAGVKGIEHVPFINEDTVKRLKKADVFVETNNALVLGNSIEFFKQSMPESSFKKMLEAIKSIKTVLPLLAKHDVKMVYGSDLVAPWDQTLASEKTFQLAEFGIMKKWFSNIQMLRAVTSNPGDYVKLLGKNNPWPEGDLGVIKKGAYADILLVKGNPLKNIMVLSDDKNFDIIMKDGVVYKNTL